MTSSSLNITIMDKNHTNTLLQETYERLFEHLLVIKKQLGHKVDTLENVHNKLMTAGAHVGFAETGPIR